MVTRLTGDSWLPWQEQLMMREVANPTAAVAELVQQFIRPHFELLLTIIDELVPAATPDTTRHQIAFSVVGQCLHYKVARPFIALLVGPKEVATYTAKQLADHIYRFSLAAIQSMQPEPKNPPRPNAPTRRNTTSTKKTPS